MVRLSLGYPSADDEADMFAAHADRDRVRDLEPVAEVGTVLAAQAAAAAMHGSEPLRRYIVAICEATREHAGVELGASPRAGLMLFRPRRRSPRWRAATWWNASPRSSGPSRDGRQEMTRPRRRQARTQGARIAALVGRLRTQHG